MKTLISMTDFVLSDEVKSTLEYSDSYKIIRSYAQFLKQPLTLGMFVPCVDNEPFNYSKHGNKEQHQKAKERVLFKGFKIQYLENGIYVTIKKENIILTWSYKDRDFLLNNGRCIERFVELNLTLTPYALKQIGL